MSDEQLDTLRYLPRRDVVRVCAELDLVDSVTRTLIDHAEGRTTLPEEAYLPWETSDGAFARSLTLPGAVWGERPALGAKVINSSLANPGRGLPRAQGLTLVFDRERAHPVALMEAAYISALRTSAYTVLTARTLAAAEPGRIGVIGCGALGEQHVRLLAEEYPGAEFVVFDAVEGRAPALAGRFAADGLAVRPVSRARDAVDGCAIVVTTTTTTTGYLPEAWLSPVLWSPMSRSTTFFRTWCTGPGSWSWTTGGSSRPTTGGCWAVCTGPVNCWARTRPPRRGRAPRPGWWTPRWGRSCPAGTPGAVHRSRPS